MVTFRRFSCQEVSPGSFLNLHSGTSFFICVELFSNISWEKIRFISKWASNIIYFTGEEKPCFLHTHVGHINSVHTLAVHVHAAHIHDSIHLSHALPCPACPHSARPCCMQYVLQKRDGRRAKAVFRGLSAVCQFHYWSWHLA